MDLVVGASRLPQAGETVTGLSFATFEGGKGFNQAVAALENSTNNPRNRSPWAALARLNPPTLPVAGL